jgi:DNA (cytosine-5)-methyltransferase 1
MLWLVKMISDDQIVFYGNRVDDIRIQGDVINTLQARMGTGGGNVPMVFEPKSAFEENWAESEVKNALRANASKSSHAVVEQAVAIQGNMIGRADTAGPQSKGYTEEGEPMFTLTETDVHAVASSTVRRLTPMECERLQGFPDEWTKYDSDGKEQADSHRYKQMGNAVTVNVIEWIGFRL